MAPTSRTISLEEAVLENQDLLTRILIGFPAKPLIQLKAVAKSWLGLISNPEFASRHTLLHHPTNPSAFFVISSRNYWFQFISLLSKPTATKPLCSFPLSRLKIIQSCNGLVLLSSVHPTDRVLHHVCNPTTNQLTTLQHGQEFLMVSMAFDPRRSLHYNVIGVSKPVTVAEFLSEPQLHVYSSESQEWRARDLVPTFKMVYRQSAYCHGAVYWISYDGSGLRFDIDQEILTIIPKHDADSIRRKHLYVTNGHLQLAQTTDPWFIVRELQSDYSGWCIKYRIQLVDLWRSFPEIISAEEKYVFTFLHMVEEDAEEMGPSMWFHVRGKVVSYNFRDRCFSVIHNLGSGFWDTHMRSEQFGWHVHPLNESLAPV